MLLHTQPSTVADESGDRLVMINADMEKILNVTVSDSSLHHDVTHTCYIHHSSSASLVSNFHYIPQYKKF